MLIAIVLALGASSFASTRPATAPAELELPPKVRYLTDRLLEDMQQRWYMLAKAAEGLKRLEEAGVRFGRQMQDLAENVPPELAAAARRDEGWDIRAKLIAIAVDRAQHPDQYAQIGNRYILFPLDPEKRFTLAPYPTKEHVNENHRLAWEYWLLWPGFDLPRGNAGDRVLYALITIRNPATLLSLEYCYRLTCREVASRRRVQEVQLILLRSMLAFKNEEGLRTVLRCLAEADHLPYKNDPEYKQKWSWHNGGPSEYVAHLLGEPAVRAKWQEIIRGMDRSALPEPELRKLDHLERSVRQATQPGH